MNLNSFKQSLFSCFSNMLCWRLRAKFMCCFHRNNGGALKSDQHVGSDRLNTLCDTSVFDKSYSGANHDDACVAAR